MYHQWANCVKFDLFYPIASDCAKNTAEHIGKKKAEQYGAANPIILAETGVVRRLTIFSALSVPAIQGGLTLCSGP